MTKKNQSDPRPYDPNDPYSEPDALVVGDQLTHPVGGGTFAQAVRAVRERNATVICALDNRPVVKFDQVALQSTAWFIVDPATGAPVPINVAEEDAVQVAEEA